MMSPKTVFVMAAIVGVSMIPAQADVITFSTYPEGTDLVGQTLPLSIGATLTWNGPTPYQWQTWASDHPDHTGDAAHMLGQPDMTDLSLNQLVNVPSLWVDFNHTVISSFGGNLTQITSGLNGASTVWSTTLNLDINNPDKWFEVTAGAGIAVDRVAFSDNSGDGWAPDVDDITIAAVVPEPSTIALALLGAAGLLVRKKK